MRDFVIIIIYQTSAGWGEFFNLISENKTRATRTRMTKMQQLIGPEKREFDQRFQQQDRHQEKQVKMSAAAYRRGYIIIRKWDSRYI